MDQGFQEVARQGAGYRLYIRSRKEAKYPCQIRQRIVAEHRPRYEENPRDPIQATEPIHQATAEGRQEAGIEGRREGSHQAHPSHRAQGHRGATLQRSSQQNQTETRRETETCGGGWNGHGLIAAGLLWKLLKTVFAERSVVRSRKCLCSSKYILSGMEEFGLLNL